MSSEEPTTFKERVAEFWKWYPTVADRFYKTIEENQCGDLVGEVGSQMNRLLYDMAWVFGPGENGEGHSLTVSGEGIVVKQLLAKYWAECAPKIPGWTFYGSRQPSPPDKLVDMQISVSDEDSVDACSFMIQVTPNDEVHDFDIVAWHENLQMVPEEHHNQILFLLLDEALGEFGTSMWIGEIEIRPITPEESTVTIDELGPYIAERVATLAWEKLPPLDEYAVYKLPEQADFPRGDTVVGISCIPDAIYELLESNGTLIEDLLEDTGAELVYVQLDGELFESGSESDKRGEIEDALEECLLKNQSGYTLGGAFGTKHSYIDMILFDGDNSRKLVKQALTEMNLAHRSRLVSFC